MNKKRKLTLSSLGMNINLLEAPSDLEALTFPDSSAQTCRDWWDWTGNNYVNQIDSGL